MTTSRLLRAALAAAAALPLVASDASAQRNSSPFGAAATLNGQRLAAPSPLLLRVDAPLPGSGLPDPSLAMSYGTTVNGVNVDGIARIETPIPGMPGYSYYCTAQRIGLRTLLTAAHCVTNDDGGLLSTVNGTVARFRGPDGSGGTQWHTFGASDVHVRSEWAGFQYSYLKYDVAVINFAEALPNWITTYDLFGGNPVGQLSTHVGYGTHGTGVGATGFDGRRRWGTNRVDWVENDPTWYADDMLLADFDDGSRTWDTFCLVGIACDRGQGDEAGAAPGDSGGPLFIGGKLAGITSFGSYFCADAACTPYAADPSRPTNAFGSFGGWAPVDLNREWIRSVSAVPEPGTYALVGTGLLALAGIARRRRA